VCVCVRVSVCVCVLLSDILWNAFEMHLANGQNEAWPKSANIKPHLKLVLFVAVAIVAVVVGALVVALECVPERPSDLSFLSGIK